MTESVEREAVPTGVLCVITGPRGKVFAGVSFSRGQAAGSTQRGQQRMEARRAAYEKLWKASVSVWLADVDQYSRDSIIERLLDGREWYITYLDVGVGS